MFQFTNNVLNMNYAEKTLYCLYYLYRREIEHYLRSPIMHSRIPTIKASRIASSVYNSSDGSTILLKTLETSRETNATGPIASWRDEPNMAYTKMGTKPVSAPKTNMKIQKSQRKF